MLVFNRQQVTLISRLFVFFCSHLMHEVKAILIPNLLSDHFEKSKSALGHPQQNGNWEGNELLLFLCHHVHKEAMFLKRKQSKSSRNDTLVTLCSFVTQSDNTDKPGNYAF